MWQTILNLSPLREIGLKHVKRTRTISNRMPDAKFSTAVSELLGIGEIDSFKNVFLALSSR